MSILERIAQMPLGWVAVIVVALWLGRCIMLKRQGSLARQAAELFESLAIAAALVFFIIRPFIVQAFFIPSESMLPTLRVGEHILVSKFSYRIGEPKRGDVVVFRAPRAATPDGERKDFIKRVIGVPEDVVRVTPGYVEVDGSRLDHREIADDLAGLTKRGDPRWVRLTRDSVVLDGKPLSKAQLAHELGAAPGKVKIVPGKVLINGKAISEPYLAEDPDINYPILNGPYSTPSRWLSKDSKGTYDVRIPKGRLLVMGDNRNNSFDSRFWGLLDRSAVLGKAVVSFWPLNRIGAVR